MWSTGGNGFRRFFWLSRRFFDVGREWKIGFEQPRPAAGRSAAGPEAGHELTFHLDHPVGTGQGEKR